MTSPKIEDALVRGKEAYQVSQDSDDPVTVFEAMIKAHFAFGEVSGGDHPITDTLEWAQWNVNLGRLFGDVQQVLTEENIPGARRAAVHSYLMAVPALMETNEREAWATVQIELSDAFLAYAEVLPEEEARQNFDYALQCCDKVMDVRTREETPTLWADAQARAGMISARYAEILPEDEARSVLARGAMRFEKALEIITPDTHPEEWPRLADYLAAMLGVLAETTPHEMEARAASDRRWDLTQMALSRVSVEEDRARWLVLAERLGDARNRQAQFAAEDFETVRYRELEIEAWENLLAHLALGQDDPAEGRARLKLGQALLEKSNQGETEDLASLNGAIVHLEIAVDILRHMDEVPAGHPEAYLGFVLFLKVVAEAQRDSGLLDLLTTSETMLTTARSKIDPEIDPLMRDAVDENLRALDAYRQSLD